MDSPGIFLLMNRYTITTCVPNIKDNNIHSFEIPILQPEKGLEDIIVMRGITFILAVYSASIVFYGGAEMLHDGLHYMADHFQSSVHSHAHDHHHTYHDHGSHQHNHAAVHTHQLPNKAEDSFPILIHFFLFAQGNPEFVFGDSCFIAFYRHYSTILFFTAPNPLTPPPRQS